MLNDERETYKKLRISWKNEQQGEFMLTKEQGDSEVELADTQLSSGELTLLFLVGDIVRRLSLANPFGEDILKGKGIVLIDEIDLHLHPSKQRTVIDKLQSIFPNLQFIITTHSPQILSKVSNHQIKILENYQIKPYTPHTKGRDTNSILLDIFRVKKRPEEYQEKLNEFYQYIDNEDENNAEKILEILKQDWGEDDRAIQRAQSYLELL